MTSQSIKPLTSITTKQTIENEYSYSTLETCENKISSQRNINIYDIIIAQIEYKNVLQLIIFFKVNNMKKELIVMKQCHQL